jgi:putative transposase
MKYQFIQAHRDRYPIRQLCQVLRVSVSGFYAAQARPVSPRRRWQTGLTDRIRAIHDASRATYGAPRVHAELIVQGQVCCKNTVAKLMRKADIVPKTVRRFRVTTDSRNTKASPNLLGRVFSATEPNEIWLTDVTFILTREGWLYLAAILDLYSRSVVGWAMRERLDRKLVMDALLMALDRRGVAPGIHHSDQSTLYAMGAYRELLAQRGIRQSMSRKGDCWDNAPMESFFHTLKTELVDHCDYMTRDQARSSLFEYMEVFYNRQRRHSALAYESPLNFEVLNRPFVKASTVRG